MRAPLDPARRLLGAGQTIASPESGAVYQVERLLGAGGFGQAYLARRISRAEHGPPVVCIKVSEHIDAWVREAYFGQLLDGHPRAIGVFDKFPLVRAGRPVLYCLALEYAPHGDLQAFLHRTGKAVAGADGAPRDRGHPRGPAASCTAARCSTATSPP